MDANWWFGPNSVWAQSGLKEGITGKGNRPGGLAGFFSGFGDALGSWLKKPKIEMDHGPDETMKYVIGGIILYMVLKK